MNNIGAAVIQLQDHCIEENQDGYEVLAPCGRQRVPAKLFVKAFHPARQLVSIDEAMYGMVVYRLYRFCPHFIPIYAAGTVKGTAKVARGITETFVTDPPVIVSKACTMSVADFIKLTVSEVIRRQCPRTGRIIEYHKKPEVQAAQRLLSRLDALMASQTFMEQRLQDLDAELPALDAKIRGLRSNVNEMRSHGGFLDAYIAIFEDKLNEQVEQYDHLKITLPREISETRILLAANSVEVEDLRSKAKFADQLRSTIHGPEPDLQDYYEDKQIIDDNVRELLALIRLQMTVIDYCLLRYNDTEQSDYHADNFLVDLIPIVDGVPQGSLNYHGHDLAKLTHITYSIDGKQISVPMRFEMSRDFGFVFVVKLGDPAQMLTGSFTYNPAFQNLIHVDQSVTNVGYRSIKTNDGEERINPKMVYRHFRSNPLHTYVPIKPGLYYETPNIMEHLYIPEIVSYNFLLDFLAVNLRSQTPHPNQTLRIDWNILENTRSKITYGGRRNRRRDQRGGKLMKMRRG